MELAQEVLRQIPTKSKIVYLPLPSDDPKTRCPDLSKTKSVLKGWEPKVALKDGLARAIPWFREAINRQ